MCVVTHEIMSPRLRVIYDGRWQGGGIGRFSAEVIDRLQNGEIRLRPIKIDHKIADPFGPVALSRGMRGVSADVFWSPGFVPPFRCDIPAVITVHDLIHREHGGVIMKRIYYDRMIRPLARNVYAILTVSEYSRKMIMQWFGEAAPPVIVVGNGVSASFTPKGERYLAPVPYALYCGNQRSHKNIARMLEAFSLSKAAGTLLLGMTGMPEQATNALIRRYAFTDRVFWFGKLDEAQLAAAYRGAEFLMMVSLKEGLGLPVIEAMACGTPVLCSSTTSLGEVAGDAAVTVDPQDAECIAAGIERIITDSVLRYLLRQLGLRRANDFSWDNVAQRVGDVLERAAGA